MNCRHHHCRVLTVGEYVRIYEAAMGGPCPFVAGRWEHEPISRRCLKCDAQVSLGQSDEAPVTVEVRAADLAYGLAGFREQELYGWRSANLGLFPFPGEDAGYLAHAIAHHDNEQAAGQALSDDGTTERA